MGTYLADALLKTGKHSITAITREGSKSKIPAGVNVATVDYDNEDSLVNALKGHQFLTISLSTFAPPESQHKLIRAAAKAGVPWVMPNCYGTDFCNKSLAQENMTGPAMLDAVEAAEQTGISWVAMCSNFWYEYSIAQGNPWYGIDIKNKKATFYDDGKTIVNTSTWQQCGRAFASLLSLKELPEDENDKSPTISQWRNKPLYISSFRTCQREILDSIQRVTGQSDKDWTIEFEKSDARQKRGLELLKQGDHSGFVLAMYARTFFPNGDADTETKRGLANDALGLPKEDQDEASNRAIEMVQSGWKYR